MLLGRDSFCSTTRITTSTRRVLGSSDARLGETGSARPGSDGRCACFGQESRDDTGIVTNFAAEGTARDASDRGYRVIVPGDCCESVSDEMHAFAIAQILPAIGEVITAAEFVDW